MDAKQLEEYYETMRPEFGFTIMSNGKVLRGKNPTSYTEDMIQEHYLQWLTMKKQGCFEAVGKTESQVPISPQKMVEEPKADGATSSSTKQGEQKEKKDEKTKQHAKTKKNKYHHR